MSSQTRLMAKAPAYSFSPIAERPQFRLLVRHLLDRFFNNEMVSVDGETLPLIMTIAWAIALPTLVATIFLFPAYHAFPPHPPTPPFWSQVTNHYFYVMYAWVVMGGITVFEWDLLFPNVLDVFVLSVLPISNRRLLFARALALVIFLGLFLLGTSSLGIVFFPLATEPSDVLRAFAAHFIAVTAAGLCAAAQVLALQGFLICVFGARIFRIVSTYLQSLLVMVLSIALFLFPLLARSLAGLIPSGSKAVGCFPPFWFLGVYESLLAGPSSLPAFTRLAHIGYWATALLILLAIITYPIAYKRSTGHAVEGSVAPHRRDLLVRPLVRLLHVTLVRTPSRRAIYHFLSQTLLRSQRHRLYLAIYAGVGIGLACSWILIFRVEGGRVGISISANGIRLAVPALAFWTVAGLCTALLSPADPAGSWVFRLIQGRVSADDLAAVKLWVLLWAQAVIVAAVAILELISYPELRGMRELFAQVMIATGICLLLTDIFLLQMRIIPFTEARVPHNTDLAFLLLRYIVFFPVLVLATVDFEPWIEASAKEMIATAFLIAAAHFGLGYIHRRMMAERATRGVAEEEGEFSQILGLRG